MRAEHAEEMNRAKAQLDAMRETENRRALNAYYKARYRARQSNKDTIFKSSAELIIKCIWELIESLSTSKKLKTRNSGITVESSNNNNYCRQNAGPEDVHPNDWREDQHLVPPLGLSGNTDQPMLLPPVGPTEPCQSARPTTPPCTTWRTWWYLGGRWTDSLTSVPV